jgi:hypothetical protein
MNDAKYIGLDVHQATISAVVLDFSRIARTAVVVGVACP